MAEMGALWDVVSPPDAFKVVFRESFARSDGASCEVYTQAFEAI